MNRSNSPTVVFMSAGTGSKGFTTAMEVLLSLANSARSNAMTMSYYVTQGKFTGLIQPVTVSVIYSLPKYTSIYKSKGGNTWLKTTSLKGISQCPLGSTVSPMQIQLDRIRRREFFNVSAGGKFTEFTTLTAHDRYFPCRYQFYPERSGVQYLVENNRLAGASSTPMPVLMLPCR